MLLDNKYSARSSQIGMAGLGPEWVRALVIDLISTFVLGIDTKAQILYVYVESQANTQFQYLHLQVNQYRNEPDFLNRNYMTHNSFYGTGCKDDPYRPMRPFEPGRGRELWMHQTRQHVQPNNSMSTNHLHYPMLRSARGWGNRD